jgi:hypothetical protein
MKAFFVCLSFDRRVQLQKSKNPKIQKEKHSEGVHKALAAMRHTKPEPDKIGLVSLI